MENNSNATPSTPAQPAGQPQVVQIPQVVKVPVEDPAWYQKWWGIAAIGVGCAVGGYVVAKCLTSNDAVVVEAAPAAGDVMRGVVSAII